jgi:alanine-glyoxylate transaminase/serine-glyoxylate transaminase/serine-pyruvate transaminase
LLVIPGPIEVADEVLLANASASVSHVSAGFIAIFGETLKMLLRLLYTSAEAGSQAFVVSGSGTLGWDMVAANLVERGERVLVLSNGYFGDAFRDCLEVYGAEVEVLSAQLGHTITPSELEKHLQEAKQTYKLITITHCDTSTGVLADAKGLAAVASRLSPDSLLVLDSVCSVASEEIRLDDWKLDVVLSASQKGLGTPPGLCIFVASSRALKTLDCRKSPPGSYYASWKKWLPSKSPSFFFIQPQTKAHWLTLSLLSHEGLSGWLTGLFCYPVRSYTPFFKIWSLALIVIPLSL